MRDHAVVAGGDADGCHDVHPEEDESIFPEEGVVPEEDHRGHRPCDGQDDECEDACFVDEVCSLLLHVRVVCRRGRKKQGIARL